MSTTLCRHSGGGGERQSLTPLLSKNYDKLLGHKDFLFHPSYTNLCRSTLTNSTTSLVDRIMKHGKAQ